MNRYEWIIHCLILVIWGIIGMSSLDYLYETGSAHWAILLVLSICIGGGQLVAILREMNDDVPF